MKNLNANNRRYLIVMYQHWFINRYKCTLMQDVNKRGNGARERGGIWDFVLSF